MRSWLLLDQHPCDAQLSGVVVQQGVRDGTQVVLTQDREEVAADIQLRQAANDRSVLHQIGHLDRGGIMAAGGIVAAAGGHDIDGLPGHDLRNALGGLCDVKAVHTQRGYAVIGGMGMAGNRQAEKGGGVLHCGQGRQGTVLNQQPPVLRADCALSVKETAARMGGGVPVVAKGEFFGEALLPPAFR